MGVIAAPTAAADCNSTGSTTLCASGGSVRGGSGAPASVPVYDPYPCVGDPWCDLYDNYNPGIEWDLPDINRPGRPGGPDGPGGPSRPGRPGRPG
ncbi:MAG: hypothetical protein KDB71_05610 [Mycobacterium sp.]|nr:hypothetical protein [Mycobacterium sp.]